MGRKPTKNLNLPKGMRARARGGRIYYLLDLGGKPRKEIPLSIDDYVAAVRKWLELTSEPAPAVSVTFRQVAERYVKELLPTKAPATQQSNLRELQNLYKFFDSPPAVLDDIEPVHIRQYLDWRGQAAKVRANREKSLLSHIWNFARSKGMTSKANPCTGIRGFRETGRDVYVDDRVYQAVYDMAEEPLRDAMDLAYLTGQRPADVLKLTRADIKDGAVWLGQDKTGMKLRVAIEGRLATVIERINGRKVMGLALINMTDGTRMTRYQLRGAMDRARAAAAIAYPALADEIRTFQFRDLRAKAATDTDEQQGISAAQEQLGHSTAGMTRKYVRHRKGKLVKPTK